MRQACIALLFAGVAVLAFAIWRGSAARQLVSQINLRQGLEPGDRMTAHVDTADVAKAIRMYAELTGLEPWPDQRQAIERLDWFCGGRLSRLGVYRPRPRPDSGISLHRDGLLTALETKEELEKTFACAGLTASRKGSRYFELVQRRGGSQPHP